LLSITLDLKVLKINYGASPGLGQSSKKGNGINDGVAGRFCVYAVSFLCATAALSLSLFE